MDNLNMFHLILSISILPMLYACWKADKIKNSSKIDEMMNKKIKE